MKSLFPQMTCFILFLFLAPFLHAHAASDAAVTIIKATKVLIEANSITISAEARSTIRLISSDPNPNYQARLGIDMPVSTIAGHSGTATFTIKRPLESDEITEKGWKMSLEAAKSLQAGNEVGRIGFYAPDIIIKANLIDSMTGSGFLYPKGM